jgi:hypothetical protein
MRGEHGKAALQVGQELGRSRTADDAPADRFHEAAPEAAAAIAVGRRAGENIAGERTAGQGRARAAGRPA